MSTETLTTCDKCQKSFYYAQDLHRCPGEWEAISGGGVAGQYDQTSWVDECMAKQYAPKKVS